jgi:formiminotetrahydrofolate cyclodeaminase
MSLRTSVSSLQVQALLDSIGSNAISPGAGAAGAIALGLAAACAGKAVGMSLKHFPDNSELKSALETLHSIAQSALAEADRDSRAFEAFTHDKLPASVERLVCEGEQFAQLIALLTATLEEVEPRIQPNMTGDVIAAKALAKAARRIQQRNEREALKSR